MNSATAFIVAVLLASSTYASAQIDLSPRTRPAYRINWENIQEDFAFDGQYAPKDGGGYAKAIYFLRQHDGALSTTAGMVLYLRPEHDGKQNPSGSIIAAYEYDDDGVRLVNQFRFKYTSNSIIDDKWVFILKGVGRTGARVY